RFTQLQPGKYLFKAQVYDGEWGKNPMFDVLSITVLPFWWQRWWFRCILAVLLILVFYVGWNYYRQRREKEMQLKMTIYEKEMSEQKIRFLININHELRTPLSLISAPLERLLKNTNSISEELRTALSGIYKQAKQMRRVIDIVLDFRKMELSANKLNLSIFDFNAFTQEILDDFQLEYAAKGIDLQFKPSEKQAVMVKLDREKCHKIINNIIVNALKFSQSSGTVTVEIQQHQNKIKLQVIDEGIGLSEVDMSKIFTRFYQANHNLGGAGIGISYSKSLAEMMGGTMGCKANANKGATFWIELPTNIDKAQIVQEDLKAEVIAPTIDTYISESIPEDYTSLKNYTILIVEDQLELNAYLKQELSVYFRKVYTASNGRLGLKSAIDNMPDCIISDVMMPEMDGYELCHQIKSTLDINHIPIILLTARTDENSAKYGYKVGADAYLTKPFSTEILLNLTANMFFLKEKMQEKFRNSGYTILPETGNYNNEEETFLRKMLSVIEEEISNPDLDVDMLADKMAVGRSTLYAKAKQLFGAGVKDFINEIRIKKAMQLLQESNLQIVEIAEKVGYNQQRYFSTVFKQYTKMTPSQYRTQKKRI
ncbi:MAG: hybrid sensor histidine kinase/response regulator transcription factor, partial [Bacteroidales bacterium]